MIRASLVDFISNSLPIDPPPVGSPTLSYIPAYIFTPDFVATEYEKPFATVRYVSELQKLWVLGDAQRKHDAKVEVTFHLRDQNERTTVRAKFISLISSAKASDANSIQRPGINFICIQDLLMNEGDNINYLSGQPNWFASPTPKVYKQLFTSEGEPDDAQPVEVTTGFTVDLIDGKIVFDAARNPLERIFATYKAGVIDFNITGIDEPSFSDLEEQLNKYNVVFTLDTHFHIKNNANRWI